MSEEAIVHDDASHYEISLTAAQAFVAFVLLLLSLAASFAFGVIIGKGQVDDRLVVRREPTVINEASTTTAKNGNSKIVELGVENNAFAAHQTAATDPATATGSDETATVDMKPNTAPPVESISQAAALSNAQPAAAAPATTPAPAAATPVVETPRTSQQAAPASGVPYFAQLLSTTDAKSAESLAARLIDGGFKEAYVERSTTEKGMIYRVRVKFASEGEARAAVDKLRSFSKGDVWVTKQ